MKKIFGYFTIGEVLLWAFSVTIILLSFFLLKNDGVLSLIASLVGVTALIFCAKGNPIGQALMIVFSILYGIISFSFAYYGEMITYLGMSAPMAVLALISWLKNPYANGKAEVKVNRIGGKEVAFMIGLTVIVTAIFYFVLKLLGTANLLVSTLSVTTSFAAVYLTFRRSPLYALAYALNDIVLIVMWIFASLSDPDYLSVIVCFFAFLLNDVYGFFNWLKMEKRQRENK